MKDFDQQDISLQYATHAADGNLSEVSMEQPPFFNPWRLGQRGWLLYSEKFRSQ
jgi:hypothetical protein